MKNIITLLAFTVAIASAQNTATHTPEEFAAHKEKVTTAITARDYSAWQAEHDAFKGTDTRLDGKVNEANFDKFAQMVEARQSGDKVKAQALRAELGIESKGKGNGQGMGKGQGMGQGQGNCDGTGMGQGKGQGKGQKSGAGNGMGQKNKKQ